MRGTTVLLMAAITSAGTAASAAAKTPLRCDRLGGKVLKKTAKVKITSAKTGSKQIISACALPKGPVHAIAALSGESVKVGAVAGTWFSYTTSKSGQDSSGSTSYAANAAKGGGYKIFSYDPTPASTGETAGMGRYILDSRGRTASVSTEPVEGKAGEVTLSTYVSAFAPDGTQLVIDEGSPADISADSLTFISGNIGWVHSGEQHYVFYG